MSIQNARLVFNNLLLTATGLTVDPAPESTLPAAHLTNSKRSRVMRTQDTSDHAITADLAKLSLITAVALWRQNLSETATWRVRLYEDAGQSGTVVYDSGTVDVVPPKAYGDLIYGVDAYGATVFSTGQTERSASMFFDPVFARSFRIDISDSSNPDGYLEIDRLFLGSHFEPVVNFRHGLNIRYADDSTQTRTEGNSVHVDELQPYRVMSFDLGHLSDSEKTKLLEHLRIAGKRADIFVSAFPGATGETERDHAFVGRLSGVSDLTRRFHNNSTNSLEIQES